MEDKLSASRIPSLPASMFYIPAFISAEEEASILQNIPSSRWTPLSNRRLQAVPGRLTATNTLLASPLPTYLADPVVSRLGELGIFADAPHGVNHCLVNEYLPGQGIMPHEDGSAYHPVVATVSLGGSTVLDVTEKKKSSAPPVAGREEEADGVGLEPMAWRILQEPRSLLVTTGAAYADTLHGIADVREDADLSEGTVANWSLLGDRETVVANGGRNKRTTRISLTYRDVKKVSTVGSKIFGKGRK